MNEIWLTTQRIGASTLPVLITGESGTGKEVIARAVHAASGRSDREMVVVDCAAITPSLMESEIFGHTKGAFTGAASTVPGLARAAHGSTFFLDEIGELPAPVQVKLLRLLADGSFRSVGSTETSHADLRIIAATNRDLKAEVMAGRFRADLYHRLNGVHIHIPPLRERREDIAPMMAHYLQHFCTLIGRPPLSLSSRVNEALQAAPWLGNVRELVNCAHYLASLASGPSVQPADLPQAFCQIEGPQPEPIGTASSPHTPFPSIRTDLPYKMAKRAWLDIFEAHYLREILEREGGNVSAAARWAGMDRRSIQRMLKRTLPDG
jgi:DNA-binding NtrC family response regulator